jgi:type II secretory pathway component GspD/PulD (secretin)
MNRARNGCEHRVTGGDLHGSDRRNGGRVIVRTWQGQSYRESRLILSFAFAAIFLLLACTYPRIVAAANDPVSGDAQAVSDPTFATSPLTVVDPSGSVIAQATNAPSAAEAPKPVAPAAPSGTEQQPVPGQMRPGVQGLPPRPLAPGEQRPMPPPMPAGREQPSVSGQARPGVPAVQTMQPPQAAMPVAARGGQQVSLNFDDADVYSVVQTVFANILRKNYVIDPRVKGRVTFRSIAPVAEENVLPLLEVILRLNGIAMVEESGLFRIIPMSDAPREPAPVSYGRDHQAVQLTGKTLLQVIPIRFLQSTEMVKLITPFVSTNAVVVDIPKSNHMIIVDTDSNIKRLLKLIALFDNEQQKEKLPQVFVYNVQNGKAKDVATLLQQIFLGSKPPADQAAPRTAGAGTQPSQTRQAAAAPVVVASQLTGEALVSDTTKIYSDDILNAVIIVATAEDFAKIKQTLDKIDVVPRQVLIEGLIAAVNLTDNMSLGLAWSLKGTLGSVLSTTIGLNTASLASATAGKSAGFTFTGIDPSGEVRALISALATVSKAKLLAAPHILVSDNREARIQVGQQVPIVTSETYGSTTIAPQRTIQYKDIGIILKVKPRVNEGGLVSIELSQEISTYETITLFADEQQIILNKTDATTSLAVQDNQTIIIGGLIREDTTASNTGIPWLNKIPILKYLFGNSDDTRRRTEIVILLTPRVIKTIQDVSDVTGEYVEKFTDVDSSSIKKTGERYIKGINMPGKKVIDDKPEKK